MVSNDVQDLSQAWDIQGEAIEVSQKLNYEGESDFKSTAGYHGPCPTAGVSVCTGCQIQYCNPKNPFFV